MIELLLAAERMLAAGDLDHAEHLFSQVAEADPRNAIAVVGLAEVAAARLDPAAAAGHARRALEIDPENAAARRMLERSEAAAFPESPPTVEPARAGAAVLAAEPALAAEPRLAGEPGPATEAPPAGEPAPANEAPAAGAGAPATPAARRSWLDRLLRFLRRSGGGR